MNPMMKKGLAVAVIHVALIGGLGAKLLIDRATRPRVWARTLPVDPDHPLRGRYVQLRVQARSEGGSLGGGRRVNLLVRDRSLVLQEAADGAAGSARPTADGFAVLDAPLAYFIPEHVPDPSIRGAGEELWVEVTLPKSGAPRPIRLGVRRDGVITPLDLD
jgi:hypothetical protein